MKTSTIVLIAIILNFHFFNAQEGETNANPISLDKSILSGVGLKKIELKDEPDKDFYQKNLFWGEELGVFVVGTETWTNTIHNYPFDEFIYMYNGEAIVKPVQGSAQIFYAGDYFFAPKGFKGEWEVKGNHQIHYELSVITTKRKDSSKTIKGAAHRLFEKATLTGNSINVSQKSYHEQILEKGSELTVKIIGEQIGQRTLKRTDKERLIRVLAGQIKITSADSTEHTYYSGDFFVLPKGVRGIWQNDGHNLVKYLSVEKTPVVKG